MGNEVGDGVSPYEGLCHVHHKSRKTLESSCHHHGHTLRTETGAMPMSDNLYGYKVGHPHFEHSKKRKKGRPKSWFRAKVPENQKQKAEGLGT